MRRGTGSAAGNADQFGAVIEHRGDGLLFLRIPPLVGDNAVAVAIGAGKKGGVPGRGTRVRIVVIAVGEISTVIEKQAKARIAELVAVTIQVIPSELIDDDDNNQLGM